ncbi:MAG: Mth938-like domain-containing protein [Wenzhouxiangellaceae bacterium]|nr:Mth938-like domain-containing protein [Wenzhouxiangellaceae bacterium]MBS3745429.1 Mth938-like domain-containing protein [Wenzhouxiangellaceae bacterium]
MQLDEYNPEQQYYVHSLGADAIQIVETRYDYSLILSPDQGVARWPVASVSELETDHLQPILAWQPDVVLLATGRRQRFPDRSIQIEMLRNNIGLEVMTLEAAARTFNVLASEDRRVVAALIWESASR